MPDLTHPYLTGRPRPAQQQSSQSRSTSPPPRRSSPPQRQRFTVHPHPYRRIHTAIMASTLPETPFPPHLSLTYTITSLLHSLNQIRPYSTSASPPQGPIICPTGSTAEAEIFDALGMLIGRSLFETAINLINSGRMVQYILPRPSSAPSAPPAGPSQQQQQQQEERRLEIPDSDSDSESLSPSPTPTPQPQPAASEDPQANLDTPPNSLGIYAFLPPPTTDRRRAPAPVTILLPSWHCTCPSHTASLLSSSLPAIPPFLDGFPGEEDGEWGEFDLVRGVFKWGGYYSVGGEREVDACEHLVAAALLEACPGLGRGRVRERVGRRGEVAGLMIGRSFEL